MDRAIAFLIGLIGVCALMDALLIISILAVQAHDWYPMECCSGMDCAPARVESMPMPLEAGMSLVPKLPSLLKVTTMHGSVLVPANFSRRPSPDSQWHACIRGERLICLFEPPGM